MDRESVERVERIVLAEERLEFPGTLSRNTLCSQER